VLPSLIDVMAVNYDKKLLLVYQNVIFCERQSDLNMNRVIMLTALLGLNKKNTHSIRQRRISLLEMLRTVH